MLSLRFVGWFVGLSFSRFCCLALMFELLVLLFGVVVRFDLDFLVTCVCVLGSCCGVYFALENFSCDLWFCLFCCLVFRVC